MERGEILQPILENLQRVMVTYQNWVPLSGHPHNPSDPISAGYHGPLEEIHWLWGSLTGINLCFIQKPNPSRVPPTGPPSTLYYKSTPSLHLFDLLP